MARVKGPEADVIDTSASKPKRAAPPVQPAQTVSPQLAPERQRYPYNQPTIFRTGAEMWADLQRVYAAMFGRPSYQNSWYGQASAQAQANMAQPFRVGNTGRPSNMTPSGLWNPAYGTNVILNNPSFNPAAWGPPAPPTGPSAPAQYNSYIPSEIAQYQRQDANRNILPAGPQGGQPSQFARDSAAAFRLNPYAQGQIDPYFLMRQNGQVVDANTFFWDPLNPGGPGGPRNWPTFDAAAPTTTGGGGYGGWGWGGGGGGGGYTPEWADRAARWAWGKEA